MSWPASSETDRQPRRREPIFNAEGKAFSLLFAVACVAVYLYQSSLGLRAEIAFLEAFGLTPQKLTLGLEWTWQGVIIPSWLPLFTHMLVHGGFWHLFLNMIALLSFGPQVERAIGTWRMAVLFLLGGLAAALAEVYLAADPTVVMIGASGAIFAVITSYVMLWPTGWMYLFIIAMPGWAFIIVVILLHVALGWIWPVEGIAWWAHMGGLVAGAILILFLRPPGVRLFMPSPRRMRRRRGRSE